MVCYFYVGQVLHTNIAYLISIWITSKQPASMVNIFSISLNQSFSVPYVVVKNGIY